MNKALLTEAQKEQFVQDGYLVLRDLLPRQIVAMVRDDLERSLGIDAYRPETWKSTEATREWAWGAGELTVPCRSEAVEQVIGELVGPHFLRGASLHPFKNLAGLDASEAGYIPVFTYAEPGEANFVQPSGWHVDGEPDHVTLPPTCLLIVFAYLTDTPAWGGATCVQPGSHRKVFEQLVRNGTLPSRQGEGVPLEGKAGDVIFMHFLLVHSGSRNTSDHVRMGLNTNVLPAPDHPALAGPGLASQDGTSLGRTLRTDNIPGID